MYLYRYAATLTLAAGLVACGNTQHWAMPNLVGSNLQDAQNRVQQLTDNSVRTTSHDHTGQDREQAVDRDWKVCGQSEKPGDTITEESSVDFAVVKNNETC